ncbi:hypothetical protein D3C85_1922640 [compost metagenome]
MRGADVEDLVEGDLALQVVLRRAGEAGRDAEGEQRHRLAAGDETDDGWDGHGGTCKYCICIQYLF